MREDLSGQDIIQAIGKGDAVAFRRVFDTCYSDLCRYAFTILRDEQDAEDIVQAILMKLWERREELDIQQDIRSYLFRSVYNQCVNQREHQAVKRKHAERTQVNLKAAIQLPEVFSGELEDKVSKAIEMLPTQCRIIFVMSRYEELRYAEIAEKLNLSVNTIQNQICKALKILREQLNHI